MENLEATVAIAGNNLDAANYDRFVAEQQVFAGLHDATAKVVRFIEAKGIGSSQHPLIAMNESQADVAWQAQSTQGRWLPELPFSAPSRWSWLPYQDEDEDEI